MRSHYHFYLKAVESLIIIVSLWFGSLLPYLASSQQQLIARPLNKPMAWLGFIALQCVALITLYTRHDAISASLVWLMLLMCTWTFLTLIAAYFPQRIALVSLLGLTFFSLISLSGESYVA